VDVAGELRLQWVWDARNDPVEALEGHLVAVRAAVAPLGTTRWLGGALDLRYFWRLSDDFGLAVRALWEGIQGLDDAGVPVGVRPFGGGAWGMRGFGTRRLGIPGEVCAGEACRSVGLGAGSLLEGSLELRWLPFRKQAGAVAFLDVGGVGRGLDPLSGGVAVAPGLGLRVRLWHLTLSLDLAWRAIETAMHAPLDRWHGFLRVGEAF
jgi:outer membrane protein assembly factor BamA